MKLGKLLADASSAHALRQFPYLDRLKQTQRQANLGAPMSMWRLRRRFRWCRFRQKVGLIVAGSAMAGLLLGFTYALMADRLCRGFCSAQELERNWACLFWPPSPIWATAAIRRSRWNRWRGLIPNFSEGVGAVKLALLPAEG